MASGEIAVCQIRWEEALRVKGRVLNKKAGLVEEVAVHEGMSTVRSTYSVDGRQRTVFLLQRTEVLCSGVGRACCHRV
jgi:hypothetical protein